MDWRGGEDEGKSDERRGDEATAKRDWGGREAVSGARGGPGMVMGPWHDWTNEGGSPGMSEGGWMTGLDEPPVRSSPAYQYHLVARPSQVLSLKWANGSALALTLTCKKRREPGIIAYSKYSVSPRTPYSE